MNKRFTFALLMLGGILTLSSCSEDKDMEVFVGDNFSTDRQKIIDELNALNFPTSFTESDDKHPEYKKMDPETYSSKQRTEGKGLEGYYGYVDLGLSVKWAASNIGSVSPVNKQTSLDEMLQELEQEMNLQPMEKPSFTNKENSTYPAIMTYDEYLKSMDIKELGCPVLCSNINSLV